MIRLLAAALFVACALHVTSLHSLAQEVHFFQEGGVTYQETRRAIETPTAEVQMKQEKETYFAYQPKTIEHEANRYVGVPVTTYHWQRVVAGIWNPFHGGQTAYQLVPHTQWQWRTEKVKIPVTTGEWVVKTRTVQRPQRILDIATEEKVERVAVGSAPARTAAAPTIPQRSAPSIAQRTVPSQPNCAAQSIPHPSQPMIAHGAEPRTAQPTSPLGIPDAARQVAGPVSSQSSIWGGVSRLDSDPPRLSTRPQLLDGVMRR